MNYNFNVMQFSSFPGYDFIWTDPPWGERMVKFFNTMAFKHTGKRPETTFLQIMTHFARLADTDKHIVMEFDVKGWKEVVKIMVDGGHRFIDAVPAVQSMGREFVLLRFNRQIDLVIDGFKGFDIITESLKHYSGRVVFDPFAGIGLTAKAVRKARCQYIGSEMNTQRYQRLCAANP